MRFFSMLFEIQFDQLQKDNNNNKKKYKYILCICICINKLMNIRDMRFIYLGIK